jgi:flagellar motor component MotA
MTWLIGVVVGLGCALLGYALHGGNIAVLWQPTEVLSIVGLAVGYLIAGNSGRNLKATMAELLNHRPPISVSVLICYAYFLKFCRKFVEMV